MNRRWPEFQDYLSPLRQVYCAYDFCTHTILLFFIHVVSDLTEKKITFVVTNNCILSNAIKKLFWAMCVQKFQICVLLWLNYVRFQES